MRARGAALLLAALALLAACKDAAPQAPSAPSPGCAPADTAAMVWIPGGRFTMGEGPRYPEEGPPREVALEGFWMDAHEVTNAEFAAFVEATGYRTLAERAPPPVPGAPPEMLEPGSAMFAPPTPEHPFWWRWVPGAQWRSPGGPGTGAEPRADQPVVQIAYADAEAYAAWAGKDLPSEAQWEYAARGGAAEPAGPLAEPLDQAGRPQANYYQGAFPARDLGTDGFTTRAPVGCFAANDYGLHDMIGNVWEWTATIGARGDAAEPVGVIKGGSFLCAANYCARYRPAARQFQERGLGTDHIGFRLVDNRRPPPASSSGGPGIDRPAR